MTAIKGINFGNWLVLEKWMMPEVFEDVGVEDETWLYRKSDIGKLKVWIKNHRDTYVTEEDFKEVKKHGAEVVRIPVPYFIFGDFPNFLGCIEYLDRAFDWAEKYQLQILIDLHTVPGSQNGYDNGGLTGVCKFGQDPKMVEYVYSVLERLAMRYKDRKGLYGIEVLNEPISFWVWITSPSFRKAADKSEGKGSWYITMKFLHRFYSESYKRIRKILPEDKVIVFHDGFRLSRWGKFFSRNGMKNVMLDTHMYIFAMEKIVPFRSKWVYKLFMRYNEWSIRRASRDVPVIVGEWCIACEKEQTEHYKWIAALQMDVWKRSTAGYFYWNYQLLRDQDCEMDASWKEAWDLTRCWKHGWMPDEL